MPKFDSVFRQNFPNKQSTVTIVWLAATAHHRDAVLIGAVDQPVDGIAESRQRRHFTI